MSKKLLSAWLVKHEAHRSINSLALAKCVSLAEAWVKASDTDVIWIATRPGVMTQKQRAAFACYCVRQIWHLLQDERSKAAIESGELYCTGLSSEKDLEADDAAADAAVYAAAYAAYAVYAAADVADDAANATRRAQATWIRANIHPDFNNL